MAKAENAPIGIACSRLNLKAGWKYITSIENFRAQTPGFRPE
jgi:hypothetical protein